MKPLPPPNEGQLQFADGETRVQRDALGSKVTPFGPAEWEIGSLTQRLLLLLLLCLQSCVACPPGLRPRWEVGSSRLEVANASLPPILSVT